MEYQHSPNIYVMAEISILIQHHFIKVASISLVEPDKTLGRSLIFKGVI